MAVYVDPLMACATNSRWRWPQACHLYADTPEELHAFARRLGLRREWASDRTHGRGLLHYDLNPSRRAQAVRLGAVETDRRHIAERVRAHREAQRPA